MPRTRIKICGIRDADAALAAADAGADAIGFMFYKNSSRAITPDEASEIMAVLPPCVSTAGVFVNPMLDDFCDAEETCPTTLVQFHGQESLELVQRCGPNLVKAIRFDDATIANELATWRDIPEVDAVLIDGSAGGEGTAFDWTKLSTFVDDYPKPIFLAGGLTPDNVAEAIRIVRPYAVDVSSGVEKSRGVKDPDLIESFCEAVFEADRG